MVFTFILFLCNFYHLLTTTMDDLLKDAPRAEFAGESTRGSENPNSRLTGKPYTS